MIRGVHTMFYSSEPNELQAFLRDRLGFSSYTDVGDGWLIFNLPEADMGCRPMINQAAHRARLRFPSTATTSKRQ